VIDARRRTLLAVGGAALSSGFAGCFGGSTEDDPSAGEEKTGQEYGQFLPQAGSKINFALVQLGGKNPVFEFIESDESRDSLPTGSVLQSTVRDTLLLRSTYSLSLRQCGLYKFIDSESDPTETEIERLLASGSGTALSGNITKAKFVIAYRRNETWKSARASR
jgi:hypothetical protein